MLPETLARSLCLNTFSLAVVPSKRWRHELVFVFRNGKETHLNNIQLGRFGRNRTNVWNYAGANSFPRKGQGSALDLHPTVKPIALVSDAILDSTKRNEIVLDPFCGSGTTILAAERTGRHGCGIEIDPLYVDTAIARWERMTGKQARHATGHSQTSKPNEDSHHESPAEQLQDRLQTTATTYPVEKGAMRQSEAAI
jgi:DNA modification methylase